MCKSCFSTLWTKFTKKGSRRYGIHWHHFLACRFIWIWGSWFFDRKTQRTSPNCLKQTGLATSSGELRVDLPEVVEECVFNPSMFPPKKTIKFRVDGAWSRSKAMLERMGHGEVFQEECEERLECRQALQVNSEKNRLRLETYLKKVVGNDCSI